MMKKGRPVLANYPFQETGQVDALQRQLEDMRAALQMAEARYQRLLASTPALIFELEPDGMIADVSASICEAAGYERAYLVGSSWWKVFFPGEAAYQADALRQRLEGGDVRQYPMQLVTKTGELLQLEVTTANEYDSDGQLLRILGTAIQQMPAARQESPAGDYTRDLEARVADRTAELQEANQRLETVLNSLPIAVWIADASGKFIEKNAMADQIWGGDVPMSEGIEHYGDYVGWWTDTGEQIAADEWALARALQKGEISVGEEIDILRFDGTVGTVLNSAVPMYDDDGNITGAVAINVDITHQRQLELQAQQAREAASQKAEELDAIFGAMQDAVLVFDAQGQLSGANPAAIRTCGFDPTGMHHSRLVERLKLRHLDDTPVSSEELPANRAQRGEVVRTERLALNGAEGRRILVSESAALLYDGNNEPVGTVVVWHDVSEREELLRLIQNERDTLEAVLESIQEEVWVCDAFGQLIQINASARRTFGLDKGERYSTTSLLEMLDVRDEQGSPRPPEEAVLLRSLNGETVEGIVEQVKSPLTGEWSYRQINSTPLIDKSGQVFGAVAVVRDITHRKMAESLLEKHLSELEEQVQDRTRELADAYAELLAEIAERRVTEEVLRQSEERFRLVVESVQDYAIYALDPDGYVSSWNVGAAAIKGYQADEIIGQHFSRFFSPEDAAAGLPAAALEAAASQGRFEIESWRLRKDGTRFWANVVITALRDPDGSLRGYAKVVRDMTRRKLADEALRRQSGFVRLLQEVAVSANQAKEVDQVLLEAMGRICKQLGWLGAHAFQVEGSGEERIIRSKRLWCLPEGDSWQKFQQATEQLTLHKSEGLIGQVLDARRPLWVQDIQVDKYYLRKEAALECGLVSTVALPLLMGDEVVGVMEFFAEETLEPDADLLQLFMNIGTQLGRVYERQLSDEKLRQSEARFRTIFENAPLGIELLRIGEGGVACNPAFMRIMGTECGELDYEWLTQADILAVPEGYGHTSILMVEKAARLMNELSRGERDSYRVELPLRRKDGSWLWGRLSVSLVSPGSDEQAPLAIAMLEDVTERKQMEIDLEELKHRQIEGREVERLYLSQELHDGPMQDLYALSYYMQAYFEQLPDTIDQEPVRDMQSSLRQVVQTLRVICGELRPPTLAPFGLEKAIRSHVDQFQAKHPNLEIVLDLMVDGQTLPPSTRLALYRIYQQALSNIVRHAKASRVLVRFQLEEDEIRLEVQDNGQGFDLPDNWIDLARQGYLGLLSAQERAEALGGYLQVESTAGAGTTIRAVVPRTNPGYNVWPDEEARKR
jgi:PAS domain S-box-containing protein